MTSMGSPLSPGERRGVAEPQRAVNNAGVTVDMDRWMEAAVPDFLNLPGSLHNAIMMGNHPVPELVDEWISEYRKNPLRAIDRLYQLIISTTGSSWVINYRWMYQDSETCVRRITANLGYGARYSLVTNDEIWKQFLEKYAYFVGTLLDKCAIGGLAGIGTCQHVLGNIISFLSALNSSEFGSVRYVSTLTVLKIMTALYKIQLNFSNYEPIYQTRTEFQGAHTGKNFQAYGSKMNLKIITEINNTLSTLSRTVFESRLMDVRSEIRLICAVELAVWVQNYPKSVRVTEQHTLCVELLLYDEDVEIASNCLMALLSIYPFQLQQGSWQKMVSFYKQTLLCMAVGSNDKMAVHALKSSFIIHKHAKHFFTTEEYNIMCQLVASKSKGVAHAAGELLVAKLNAEDQVLNEDNSSSIRKRTSYQKLKDLALLIPELQLEDHVAYIVDSIMELDDFIRDWKSIATILMEEPSSGAASMNDTANRIMSEILLWSVKQFATGQPHFERDVNEVNITDTDVMKRKENVVALTNKLSPVLHGLLKRFNEDSHTLVNILALPQFFDIGVYLRDEKSFQLAMQFIKDILLTHTDLTVFECGVKTLEAIDEYSVESTNTVTRHVLDSISRSVRRCLLEYHRNPDNDAILNMNLALKKIAAFYACHDYKYNDLWDNIFQVIRKTSETADGYPFESVKSAIIACYFSLLWSLKNINNMPNPTAMINNDSSHIVKFQDRLNQYVNAITFLAADGNNTFREIRGEAYTTLCDILITFSDNDKTKNPRTFLFSRPDLTTERALTSYLLDMIFDEAGRIRNGEEPVLQRQEIHLKREKLAQFCKLIVLNVLPIGSASHILKYVVSRENDFGDILGAMLEVTIQCHSIDTALAIISSLTFAYHEAPKKLRTLTVDMESSQFNDVLTLAKIFALKFRGHDVTNREAVKTLHTEGVRFALNPLLNLHSPCGPPPNINFFQVLCEFTGLLLKEEKMELLQHLENQLATEVHVKRTKEWKPLYAYKNGLFSDW